MPHKPLDSIQEKVLYLMKVIGPSTALDILEASISSKFNVTDSLIKLKRVK